MAAMKLKKYLDRSNQSQSDLSREIGQGRATISYWVKNNAVIELTEAGIKISMPSGYIVHDSQVRK